MPAPNDDARRQVADLEALAEKAYEEMYETRFPAGCYSDLKECFTAAIEAARRAGFTEEAERLTERLDHCKQVYRSQFSSL